LTFETAAPSPDIGISDSAPGKFGSSGSEASTAPVFRKKQALFPQEEFAVGTVISYTHHRKSKITLNNK
jgi:hypothetical protein